jgi:hypothetical protein
MFNPSTGTTDTAKVLASKRYYNPSGAVGNNTLMGSFTVVGGVITPTDITYTATADGNSTTNTTTINFFFSASVTGLTADDITITDGTGSATKGTLTGGGYQWRLAVTNVTAGDVTVSINKTGIESGNKTVAVYKITMPTDAIPLTVNQWADGSIPTSDDQQWFVFTATASTQYIHAAFGTLSILDGMYVQVYDSSGVAVESDTSLSGSTTNASRSLTAGQTYYIKVRPYDSNNGTYRIGFGSIVPPPGAIPLTENQWADGSLPKNGEQWFTFTATASTQYIHVAYGTLISQWGMYVQVYDSSGVAVESDTSLRAEERRVGKERGTAWRYRRWPYH